MGAEARHDRPYAGKKRTRGSHAGSREAFPVAVYVAGIDRFWLAVLFFAVADPCWLDDFHHRAPSSIADNRAAQCLSMCDSSDAKESVFQI